MACLFGRVAALDAPRAANLTNSVIFTVDRFRIKVQEQSKINTYFRSAGASATLRETIT
jgi:hypothetical protein